MIWDRKTAPPEAVEGIPLPEGGHRLKPYFDGFRKWSIGAGSCTMPDGTAVTAHSRAITLAESHALFAAALKPRVEALAAAVAVPLTTGQAAGLVSWLYNCGVGSIVGSVIEEAANAGDMDTVLRQLPGWCEARDEVTGVLAPELGLMRRRLFEVLLMRGTEPAAAYSQAWKLQLVAGMAAYRVAFAEAASWRLGRRPATAPAGAVPPAAAPVAHAPRPLVPPVAARPRAAAPVAPRPRPRSDDAATDALNAASAAGTLPITEGS